MFFSEFQCCKQIQSEGDIEGVSESKNILIVHHKKRTSKLCWMKPYLYVKKASNQSYIIYFLNFDSLQQF